MHYIEYGVRDGYDPNAWFSTSSYLSAHPELAESGVNPLLHAVRAGAPVNVPALDSGERPAANDESPPDAGEPELSALPAVPQAPERRTSRSPWPRHRPGTAPRTRPADSR